MQGIHHAGIVVSQLDRAIDFYVDVLGLEMMSEPAAPNEGPHLDSVLGLAGARLRGVLLRAGSSAIELHEFYAPPWPGGQPVPANALGAQHVAFLVDDLAVEKADIEARGGVFMTGINVIDAGPFAGLRTAFIRDPDGIRIEFVEVAYWLAAEREAAIKEYRAARMSEGGTNG
jgi:catechol 2,3-dioxygenase-like lactoylglutathione lyase family enzyme